jgi:arylsulfatase A-like enzyme
LTLGLGAQAYLTDRSAATRVPRPNILFCIADDWGWPHAGTYGDPVVQTPTFDRVADEGILFDYAYVASPSCTPCRNAILTGQYHWRLGQGANLWSTLDVNIPVYPLLLEQSGYHIGRWRKSWGPGDLKPGGYVDSHPAGKNYRKGFKDFIDQRPDDKPFCFWFGASDPHRAYDEGTGKASGMDLSKIPVPGFYPDVEAIRSDIADYYFEVQRFDRDCGQAIKLLEETGELDNTIIVITGDHGMPFPRCKSNIYDMGVRVPLAIRWGKNIKRNRRLKDFVSLTDLAPTFLQAAGLPIPGRMTGKSLMPLLQSKKDGQVQKRRDHVIFGMERHTPAQKAPSMDGYPCRGIRTHDFLYIRNLAPQRWPAGVPSGATHPMNVHSDCDNGPTKQYLIDHKNDPAIKSFYDLAFARRPAEELYLLSKDPHQLNNLADESRYAKVKKRLKSQLIAELKDTEDPRIIGGGEAFDQYPYRGPYKLNTGEG